MKKLTAGIFATLLAVVSADGAYAAIASQGYVDDKVEAVETTVAGKADSTTVTALDARVKTAEGEIDTLQTTTGQHTSQIGTINTTLSKKLDSDTAASTYQTLANKTTSVSGDSTDTQYPSAKAVWTAVQSVDANASVEALEGRVGKLETASATHATKTELTQGLAAKANTADLGDLATLDVVGSAQITDGAVATADIANKAVTKAKLADDIVTSLGKADSALQQASLNGYLTKTAADTAYAGKTLETQVGTVSKENMGTTTATTVVAGVKEAIDAAKAADTKAGSAASAASTAQSAAEAAQGAAEAAQADVDTLETAVSGQDTRLTAAEGEIDSIQSEMENMATSETVSGLQSTVTNLQSTKQDKTDNTLTTTNKTVVGAINEVKATADKKQDKLTGTVGGSMQPVYLNNGTITAGTALGTLATKSKVTNTEVDDGALAQSKINGLATTLAAKLTTPPTSERGETGLYVLTYDGTEFQWEDIARTVAE